MSYKPHCMGAIIHRAHLSAQMWLVQLDVPLASHTPGDSIAIWPKNRPAFVQELLHYLKVDPHYIVHTPLGDTTLQCWLEDDVELNLSPKLRTAMIDAGIPESTLHEHHTAWLPLMKQHITSEQALPLLLDNLSAMRPRFYSIASGTSSKHLELMVSYVYDPISHKEGIGSSFLTKYAPLHSYTIPCRLHPIRHHVPNSDLIMIATGSGMAPFRAYMQETTAQAKRWLFFGEKHASDWYFQPFWEEQAAQGKLRITTAFSREQASKVYVQHKLWEHKDEIWQWINSGAALYVCGNKTMAREVEQCILNIASTFLGSSTPTQWLQTFRASGKYIQDVY